MTPFYPTDLITIRGAIPQRMLVTARDFIASLPPEEFDTYKHPWEPKLMVKRRHYTKEPSLNELLWFLRSGKFCHFFSGLFGIDDEFGYHRLAPAGDYFTAFYVYRRGDYLQSHLDAAVHDDERKVVTANLYLTDCCGGELDLGGKMLPAESNTLVAFVNHDNSQHGVEPVTDGFRIMVTVGYSLPAKLFPRERFSHGGGKAWFVPGPGQVWSQEQYAMRDSRASDNWRPT